MKLYLDDCRPAPTGWTRAYTMAEAQRLVENNIIEDMSLDHDLGTVPLCDDCRDRETSESEIEDPVECRCSCHRTLAPTGYDFVKWMAETNYWSLNKPTVHSMNPVGKRNMEAVIDRYWFDPRS